MRAANRMILVSIEIDLLVVRVVEIDVILAWGMGVDLISV